MCRGALRIHLPLILTIPVHVLLIHSPICLLVHSSTHSVHNNHLEHCFTSVLPPTSVECIRNSQNCATIFFLQKEKG
ncbi:hypothetical protein M758_UG013300 [Ceratodon purpureus]|nr:hypothetical protein M758_UG013300 [Ceratodon purpureus]